MAEETLRDMPPITTIANRHADGRTVTRSVACQLRRSARQLSALVELSAQPDADQYSILSALQSVNRALVELEPGCA